MLVIDVDEAIGSREDMDNALCGFRAVKDSVEIFDKDAAIRMFCEALKEALHSGCCEMEVDCG